FAGMSVGLLVIAMVLRGGGSGGVWVFLALALTGASNAFAFSPLMTGVLMRVPVSDAADATGVVVTVNQLALVVAVASLGPICLNLAGPVPAAAAGAFRGLSAPAEFLTCLALAGVAACGGVLAAARAWSQERPRAAARPRTRPLAQVRPEAVGPAER